MHRFTVYNTRRFHLNAATRAGFDRAFAVDRVAKRIDHTAQQLIAHGHVHNRAGPLDGVAFFDAAVIAENYYADIVGGEVQRHTAQAFREFDHFAGLNIFEAVNGGHAIAHRYDLTDFSQRRLIGIAGDLLFDDVRNFRRTNLHA